MAQKREREAQHWRTADNIVPKLEILDFGSRLKSQEPEAPPLENTDYMFSIRPVFREEGLQRRVLCNPS